MKREAQRPKRTAGKVTKAAQASAWKQPPREKFEWEEDEFDPTRPLDTEKDLCAFCKEGHYYGVIMDQQLRSKKEIDDGDEDEVDDWERKADILDPSGIWASRYALKRYTAPTFVHFFCAVYSPQTWFTGSKWHNIRKELIRSTLMCKHCNKRGATLGCQQARCNFVVHIPCGMQLGFHPIRLATSAKFYCLDHRVKEEKQDIVEDKKLETDISNGREPIPIEFSNDVDKEPFPRGFEYVANNLDSDAVYCSFSDINYVHRCKCEGMCFDVNQCSCISVQRNYTMQGTLIPGLTSPILECNLTCSCSIRRCTNRVVQKGIRFHIVVFRQNRKRYAMSPSPAKLREDAAKRMRTLIGTGGSMQSAEDEEGLAISSTSSSTEGWGVKTLDFIPAGSFVCEVVGQYVDAGSKVSGFDVNAVTEETVTVSEILQRDSDDERVQHLHSLDDWEPPVAGIAPRSATTAASTSPMTHSTSWMSEEDSDVAGSFRIPSVSPDTEDVPKHRKIWIDTRRFGNVSRFLKPRALIEPPMLIRKLVYTDTVSEANVGNKPLARLALFAAHDIEAGTELKL